MRYGFIIPKGDPRTVAELAREAEAAGWDGVFHYDAICVGEGLEIYDPWVVMAAMAMKTERVRIGAVLTPPARRRPWKLARETMTLDHLSGGRLVLPVGLGPWTMVASRRSGNRRTARSAPSCWMRAWRS